MKMKVILSLSVIIGIIILIIFFNKKINSNIKNDIEIIPDSVYYGYSEWTMKIYFKRAKEISGFEFYNFLDTNFFKNKTFYFALKEIEKKYTLLDSGCSYHTSYIINTIWLRFYADSNYIYNLSVYLPVDTVNKSKNLYNSLLGTKKYKVFQSRESIPKLIELAKRVNKLNKNSTDEYSTFFRKIDSLKAVLKR